MTGEPVRGREPGAGETLRDALLILAAGIVFGVAWNALGLASRPPYGLAWIERPPASAGVVAAAPAPWSTLELGAFKQLYDTGGALILDARETRQYEEGHIAGAISLPFSGAPADPERVRRLDSGGRPIVVYCLSRTCELSKDLARLLIESGKREVLVLEGGFREWEAAGYPVARGPAAGSRP